MPKTTVKPFPNNHALCATHANMWACLTGDPEVNPDDWYEARDMERIVCAGERDPRLLPKAFLSQLWREVAAATVVELREGAPTPEGFDAGVNELLKGVDSTTELLPYFRGAENMESISELIESAKFATTDM